MIELLLFCTGIVAGVMNAIAGGGALITLPMMIATGIPPLVANVTNHFAVLPGQFLTVVRLRKHLKKVSRVYLVLTIPCFIGSVIGAIILRNTEPHNFAKLIPALLLFAVVMFTVQPYIHGHVHSVIHPSRFKRKHLPNRWRKLFLLTLAILPIAIYGGFFGAGFGFIMLAFLSFTNMKHMNEMTAVKSLLGLCTLVAACVCLIGSGLIDWQHAAIIASGNIFGGWFGGSLAERVSSRKLRIAVIIIGFIAVGHLAMRQYDTGQQIQTMLQSPLSLAFRVPSN